MNKLYRATVNSKWFYLIGAVLLTIVGISNLLNGNLFLGIFGLLIASGDLFIGISMILKERVGRKYRWSSVHDEDNTTDRDLVD